MAVMPSNAAGIHYRERVAGEVRLPDDKTFFPGEPEKDRWVPIFRAAPVASQSDDNITREQFR